MLVKQCWCFLAMVQDQSLWAGVEDYILNNATKDKLRVSVFTGPVFNDNDAVFREVKIPAAFWKVRFPPSLDICVVTYAIAWILHR